MNGTDRGLSLAPGADIEYTITVTNLGSREAVDVVVSDSIPAQLDYRVGSVSETLPSGVNALLEFDDGSGSWSLSPTSEGGGAPVGYDARIRFVRWSLDAPLPSSGGQNAAVFGFTARIR